MSVVALLQVIEGCSTVLTGWMILIALASTLLVAMLVALRRYSCTNASGADNIAQTSKKDCGMWAMTIEGSNPLLASADHQSVRLRLAKYRGP